MEQNEQQPNHKGAPNLGAVSCPICFQNFKNLRRLNRHLDIEHGLVDDTATGDKQHDHGSQRSSHQHGGNSKRTPVIEQITRTHWEKVEKDSKCNYCKHTLGKKTGAINCKKCGRLFCRRHARNMIKLNLRAEYDPENGQWYNCCRECFVGKPGYNDFGTVVDLTGEFRATRDVRNEDTSLRTLQLENRLIRLMDGVAAIYEKYKDSVLSNFRINAEVSNLQRSIVPWREDKEVSCCSICEYRFNLILRKHHCRLCGNIVCDDPLRRCSREIPLIFLRRITSNLPYRKSIDEIPETVQNEVIRLCLNCIRLVWLPRKFKLDSSPNSLPDLIVLYGRLNDLSKLINDLLPTFQAALKKLELDNETKDPSKAAELLQLAKLRDRLSRTITTYSTLTKQLANIEPSNSAERRIQDSIKLVASNFVNEKMHPLRTRFPVVSKQHDSGDSGNDLPSVTKFSNLLSKLTIKEIKKYREELMVYKEQSFLVESMMEEAKKQRKFDEIGMLTENLQQIESRIHEVQQLLGEYCFE